MFHIQSSVVEENLLSQFLSKRNILSHIPSTGKKVAKLVLCNVVCKKQVRLMFAALS